jgi:hypothetical protein
MHHVHVVVDSVHQIAESSWTIGGVVATLVLGLIALVTLWFTDYRQRQSLSPIVDVDGVEIVLGWDDLGDVVAIVFTVLNAGGGPALDIRMTLEHYGNVACTHDPEAYIAPLAAAATRLSPHSFHLPPRATPYTTSDPWAFSLTWNGTLATGGKTYVSKPDQKRERISLARVPLLQLRNLRSRTGK